MGWLGLDISARILFLPLISWFDFTACHSQIGHGFLNFLHLELALYTSLSQSCIVLYHLTVRSTVHRFLLPRIVTIIVVSRVLILMIVILYHPA